MTPISADKNSGQMRVAKGNPALVACQSYRPDSAFICGPLNKLPNRLYRWRRFARQLHRVLQPIHHFSDTAFQLRILTGDL
jgi:hypothetical protein